MCVPVAPAAVVQAPDCIFASEYSVACLTCLPAYACIIPAPPALRIPALSWTRYRLHITLQKCSTRFRALILRAKILNTFLHYLPRGSLLLYICTCLHCQTVSDGYQCQFSSLSSYCTCNVTVGTTVERGTGIILTMINERASYHPEKQPYIKLSLQSV